MVSGDTHLMGYDHGSERTQIHGKFPIFQCGPMDKQNSCSEDQWYAQISLKNAQFCHFKHYLDQSGKACLLFTGFASDQKVLEFDTCSGTRERLDNGEATFEALLKKYKDLTGHDLPFYELKETIEKA